MTFNKLYFVICIFYSAMILIQTATTVTCSVIWRLIISSPAHNEKRFILQSTLINGGTFSTKRGRFMFVKIIRFCCSELD